MFMLKWKQLFLPFNSISQCLNPKKSQYDSKTVLEKKLKIASIFSSSILDAVSTVHMGGGTDYIPMDWIQYDDDLEEMGTMVMY